jgi:hypothetical protein
MRIARPRSAAFAIKLCAQREQWRDP